MKYLINSVLQRYQNFLQHFKHLDGMAALALRIYLVPIFWMAGQNKLMHFSDTVEWFANPDLGLGFSLPSWLFLQLQQNLVAQYYSALGLFTRLISIPLIITIRSLRF